MPYWHAVYFKFLTLSKHIVNLLTRLLIIFINFL